MNGKLRHRCVLVNFCEFFQNTLLYRTPPMAASVIIFQNYNASPSTTFRITFIKIECLFLNYFIAFESLHLISSNKYRASNKPCPLTSAAPLTLRPE